VSAARCPFCGEPLDLDQPHEHHVASELLSAEVIDVHRTCHETLHADDPLLWRRRPVGGVDAARLGMHRSAATLEAIAANPVLDDDVRRSLVAVVGALDDLGRLLLDAEATG
jgi:hypothetical protein